MGFRGYKYRFDLNAIHNIVNPDTHVWQNVHSHTLIINLYLEKHCKEFVLFDEIEQEIDTYFDQYDGKVLNEVAPFDYIVPTIEEMGKVFYENIKEIVERKNFSLIKLEISETPSRVFIVNEGLTSDIHISKRREKLIRERLNMIAIKKPEITFEESKTEENMPQKEEAELLVEEAAVASEEAGEIQVSSMLQNDGKDNHLVETARTELTASRENVTGTLQGENSKSRTEGQSSEERESQSSERLASWKQLQDKHSTETTDETSSQSMKKRIIEKTGAFFTTLFELKKSTKLLLAIAVILLAGAALVIGLYVTNNFPYGVDIYGHLYRGNLLYEKIKEGDWYPLFSPYWYNGLQPFRYWGPVPYYLFAALEFLCNGNVMTTYLLFVGAVFCLGAFGWLLFGARVNRIGLSTVLGCMWFFFPDNFRVFFYEGNLSRVAVAIFLPYLFYFMWSYIEYKKKYCIYFIVLNMIFITLSHVMIAAMVGITAFLFTAIYSIIVKRYRESMEVIIGMLIGLLISGIWLYPALTGGLMSFDSSSNEEVLEMLSYPLHYTINPFYRLIHGSDMYYFGLSVLLICLLGLLYAGKKTAAGYLVPLIILIGTTKVAAPIISKLPLGSLLWAMRFTPIVYAAFVLALLEWKHCRKLLMFIMCLVMIFDFLPTMNFTQYKAIRNKAFTHDEEEEFIKEYSLDTVKENTTQRISVFDLSNYSSFLPYYFCIDDPKSYYTFGWSWQGANTASNIVMLNSALEGRYFYYLFDRSLEMGDDTILFSKAEIKGYNINKLTSIAKRFGYKCIKEGPNSVVYHMDVDGPFGVSTTYKGIAIGSSAREMTLRYPYFYHADRECLDEYTVEELSQYKKIYLSGFSYNNKQTAEEMLKTLAGMGVQIYIDMNRIPVDKRTNRYTFLDVSAQSIIFENKFPNLVYNESMIRPIAFAEEYSNWNTCYLTGLTKVTGSAWFNNRSLAFLGNNENENIVFLGFNLLFHGMTSGDDTILTFMDDIFGVNSTEVPKRELVPLEIEVSNDKLVITSPQDNVNTTIAYQDNFVSEKKVTCYNQLLYVNQGTTTLYYKYPYLKKGGLISIFGLLCLGLLSKKIYRRKKGKA